MVPRCTEVVRNVVDLLCRIQSGVGQIELFIAWVDSVVVPSAEHVGVQWKGIINAIGPAK